MNGLKENVKVFCNGSFDTKCGMTDVLCTVILTADIPLSESKQMTENDLWLAVKTCLVFQLFRE